MQIVALLSVAQGRFNIVFERDDFIVQVGCVNALICLDFHYFDGLPKELNLSFLQVIALDDEFVPGDDQGRYLIIEIPSVIDSNLSSITKKQKNFHGILQDFSYHRAE